MLGINVMKLDPFKQYTNLTAEYLKEWTGLIGLWLETEEEMSALDQVMRHYQWGTGSEMGGTVVEGAYLSEYVDDPPLYPLGEIRMPLSNETVYIYEYGITAFVHDDGLQHVYRMD